MQLDRRATRQVPAGPGGLGAVASNPPIAVARPAAGGFRPHAVRKPPREARGAGAHGILSAARAYNTPAGFTDASDWRISSREP